MAEVGEQAITELENAIPNAHAQPRIAPAITVSPHAQDYGRLTQLLLHRARQKQGRYRLLGLAIGLIFLLIPLTRAASFPILLAALISPYASLTSAYLFARNTPPTGWEFRQNVYKKIQANGAWQEFNTSDIEWVARFHNGYVFLGPDVLSGTLADRLVWRPYLIPFETFASNEDQLLFLQLFPDERIELY